MRANTRAHWAAVAPRALSTASNSVTRGWRLSVSHWERAALLTPAFCASFPSDKPVAVRISHKSVPTCCATCALLLLALSVTPVSPDSTTSRQKPAKCSQNCHLVHKVGTPVPLSVTGLKRSFPLAYTQ